MEFHCYRPDNLVPIFKLPEAVIKQICAYAADVAVAHSDTITVLGAVPGAAVFCRWACQYQHPGSVVVIPDVVLVELVANGFDEVRTQVLRRQDGREAHLFQVSERSVPHNT